MSYLIDGLRLPRDVRESLAQWMWTGRVNSPLLTQLSGERIKGLACVWTHVLLLSLCVTEEITLAPGQNCRG